MLEIKNISFSYEESSPILNELNATFEEGKVIAIQGESGQGKSTLLSILAGLEKDYDGSIVLDDQQIKKNELHSYNKDNISIVFQELNLIKYLSLNDNLEQGCLVKGKVCSESLKKSYMDFFNLNDLNLKEYPAKISGGQQQRIAIIRALLSDTKVILADEPTASIDTMNSNTIIDVIKLVAQKTNKIVIIVTHDDHVADECDEVYLLKDTKLIKKD